MLDKNIEIIIVKYFSQSASIDEMVALTEWMHEQSNDLIFKDFVKTNYLIDANMVDFDIEGEREKVLQKIKKDKSGLRRNTFKMVFRYAAVLFIALGFGYAYWVSDFSFVQKENIITDTNLETKILPGSDKAILTLENGSEVVLEKGKDVKLKGRTLNDDKLVYDSKSNSKNQPIKYNYLTIPKGGQYFVQLSDGTKVWLNSDSKIKYPLHFIKGQPRVVDLIYGEAYFDVSKSTNHNGDRFRVKTRMQEIEVLGTEFNIKAYQDENDIITTLVEGKVTVGNGIESKYLNPSEQSIMNIKNKDFAIHKVDKLFDEIAWKQGYFSFKHKTMKDIMKILSRWYDIDYVFMDTKLENKSFTGVLDREESIEKILMYIQKTNEINYEIKNKTVIIK